jgi:hypothetical protein
MRPGLPYGGPGFFMRTASHGRRFLKWPQVFNLRDPVPGLLLVQVKTCTHFGQVAVGF